MKKTLTAAMPQATKGLFKSDRTFLDWVVRGVACGSDGRLRHCQMPAAMATGTRQKKVPRHPITDPRKLPSGAATTVARALPLLKMARALGTCGVGTRPIATAAESDQKPPMAMPIKARPAM